MNVPINVSLVLVNPQVFMYGYVTFILCASVQFHVLQAKSECQNADTRASLCLRTRPIQILDNECAQELRFVNLLYYCYWNCISCGYVAGA